MIKILFLIFCFFVNLSFADEHDAQFYHLQDAETGDVLLSKNADIQIPPSSMTKLMTAYVVFDLVEKGVITLNKQCIVTKDAWRRGGSSMFLNQGDVVTVDDLVQGLLAVSGNDAAVALANNVAGSVENFARLMNIKSREIGMRNSNFKNPHGLYEDGHYMTLRDIATLASVFYYKFPQYLKYLSIEEFTYHNITQRNRNPLIKDHYEGSLGGKTGYTNQGGYGVVGIVRRDNRVLVGVVNKAKTPVQRKRAITKLFDLGFENYKKLEIFRKNQIIAKLPVWLGEDKFISVYVKDDVILNVKKEKEISQIHANIEFDGPIYAPINENSELAKLVIKIDGDKTLEYPLYAKKTLEKSGYLSKVKQVITFKLRNFLTK